MTPDSALTAIIARLEAAGLTKSVSPLGVSNSSAPQMNRSFSVKMQSMAPASSPDRFKPTVAGLRVSCRFIIELGHRLNPNSGQTAISHATGLDIGWAFDNRICFRRRLLRAKIPTRCGVQSVNGSVVGQVSVEIRLRSIDQMVNRIHGKVRPYTIQEQNLLTEYSFSLVEKIETEWPILTGYSLVRWAPRLETVPGDTRLYIENSAWYADWVHAKGTRRINNIWLGRPIYQDAIAEAFNQTKPNLFRDMRALIQRTEDLRRPTGTGFLQ